MEDFYYIEEQGRDPEWSHLDFLQYSELRSWIKTNAELFNETNFSAMLAVIISMQRQAFDKVGLAETQRALRDEQVPVYLIPKSSLHLPRGLYSGLPQTGDTRYPLCFEAIWAPTAEGFYQYLMSYGWDEESQMSALKELTGIPTQTK